MHPFVSALFAAGQPQDFVGITTGTWGGGAAPVTLPTGTEAGDFVVIFGNTTSNAMTMGGTSTGAWSQSILPGAFACSYKQLSDLGSITIASGTGELQNYICVAYRGPIAATQKFKGELPENGLGTFDETGFTRSGKGRAIATFVGDMNSDSSRVLTEPPSFTKGGQLASSIGVVAEAHLLDENTYADGTVLPWSGFQLTAGSGQWGLILELCA